MCGIAGFLNLSRSSFEVDKDLLDSMQKRLSHRGPDAYDVFVSDDKQLGFSHSRLSIIDLSEAGLQPMIDKERTVVVSFNGEIYNHLELRSQLEPLGYKYFSNTDTETLIYAYKEWGIDFINKLDGIFAFAIYDIVKKKLFLVRDRIGVKPLYFSIQNGMLSFASEIKAFDCLPWMDKKISDFSFYHYLTFMIVPAPNTFFENIYKLPSGFYAEIDSKKRIEFSEWYTPIKQISRQEEDNYKNEEFCLENIDLLLSQSVKKRMMADVPIGAFLSGGLDSSLIVAMMSQHTSNLKTFTVSFGGEDQRFNELGYAKKISSIFNTQHNEVFVKEKDAFDFYHKMIYQLDEPLADPVCIPFYFVSKLCRQNNIPVALVGEGADELFFGYPTYAKYKKFNDFIWSPTKKIVPSFLKKGLYNTFKIFINKRLNILDIFHNWARGKPLLWGGAIAFNEQQKKRILNQIFFSQKRFSEDKIVTSIFSGLKQDYDSVLFVEYHINKLRKLYPRADFLKEILYLEFKQRLPELLLMRADKMSMAVGLEARVPYLDHKLVEFMFNVSEDLKFKNRQTKYLLKKVAEKYIPKDIIYRNKVGFAVPIEDWLERGRYFPALYEKSSRQITSTVFRAEFIEEKYKTSRSIFAVQKWVLQNFAAINK